MPYDAKYLVGASVRIASRERLEQFVREWKFHNPLQPDQLRYAEMSDTIASVSYYFGGDVLYSLQSAPGIWHEHLLDAI